MQLVEKAGTGKESFRQKGCGRREGGGGSAGGDVRPIAVGLVHCFYVGYNLHKRCRG
jgi:uncharacterized spore protein YtfJ